MAAIEDHSLERIGIPARNGFDATAAKSDTVNFTYASRALWVGGAGNISLVTAGGDTLLLSGILAGTLIPIACKRVNSTNTTATLIIGLY